MSLHSSTRRHEDASWVCIYESRFSIGDKLRLPIDRKSRSTQEAFKGELTVMDDAGNSPQAFTLSGSAR
jgi:hypothetical protein